MAPVIGGDYGDGKGRSGCWGDSEGHVSLLIVSVRSQRFPSCRSWSKQDTSPSSSTQPSGASSSCHPVRRIERCVSDVLWQ